MSTLTVRIPKELDLLVEEFCKTEDRSKSWLLKKALQEKLMDWIDRRDAIKALKEFNAGDKKTTSLEDVAKELGIKLKS